MSSFWIDVLKISGINMIFLSLALIIYLIYMYHEKKGGSYDD